MGPQNHHLIMGPLAAHRMPCLFIPTFWLGIPHLWKMLMGRLVTFTAIVLDQVLEVQHSKSLHGRDNLWPKPASSQDPHPPQATQDGT